ncbi:ASCH domain-containing protein [Lactobacillus johnsonii]|uniref:ASCH domain-containing protein n=1 Tax=Lactobacillus johnsonii TaxID=33959 RepID=UPI0028ED74AA|nr:ASCH domain-containing protein [Lactobacillus johnsonii]MDT9605173.1 ASCH domain-containing protein [Lactobacillus johnsonii]
MKVYKFYNEAIPKVGDYSIVLNANEEPICVIKDISVKVMPYCKISSTYAFLEGEGDRSYTYWKKVHDEFFEREFKEVFNEKFDDYELMVCETFEKVD